jgi:hypothetical protein
MQDDEIRYEGEPIALGLVRMLEAAEYAGSLVRSDIEPAAFIPHPRGDRAGAEVPRESGNLSGPTDAEHGDLEPAVVGARAHLDAIYVRPSRHHNPVEPSATLAQWHDGTLTVDATQWADGVRIAMCALFDIAPECVRVRWPHTGADSAAKGWSGRTRSSPRRRHGSRCALLTYDYMSSEGFPNGRILIDDVINMNFALLYNGVVPDDRLRRHADLLSDFPYPGTRISGGGHLD